MLSSTEGFAPYSEPQLAALVAAIAAITAFNRLNAATRQLTGEWVAGLVQQAAQGSLSPV